MSIAEGLWVGLGFAFKDMKPAGTLIQSCDDGRYYAQSKSLSYFVH